MTASNEEGDGPASDASDAATFLDVPTQPDAPQVAASPGQLQVSWMAPSDTGGLTGYRLDWQSATAPDGTATFGPDITEATLGAADGLVPGASYTFTITASNAQGDGPTSDASAAATFSAPDGPVDPSEFAAICPPAQVGPAGFPDVGSSNVHRAAIDCVAWLDVGRGFTDGTYRPAQPVSRAQMASFVARLLDAAGHDLPAAGDQGFVDIAGNTHAANINRLAAAGITQGRTEDRYDPSGVVTRGQMGSFLVRAYEDAVGPLPVAPDAFGDDDGSVHEGNTNKAAAAGIARGVRPGVFEPLRDVRRDQMASFLARTGHRIVLDAG